MTHTHSLGHPVDPYDAHTHLGTRLVPMMPAWLLRKNSNAKQSVIWSSTTVPGITLPDLQAYWWSLRLDWWPGSSESCCHPLACAC